MYFHVKAALRHWLTVVDQHSIHSPFFYDFFKNVLHGKTDTSTFKAIEDIRSSLLGNTSEVPMAEWGAGSRALNENRRTLADIARVSVSPQELAELYARIIQSMDAHRIVELGSCLGLTTLYMAQNKNSQVFTFEGSHGLANVAMTNFEFLEKKNIHLIEGNIDTTLSEFIQDPAKINFVLMDANHRYAPTMKYFSMLMRRLNEQSIVVVDDIHWSPEMEQAWNELSRHPLVYGSVDLFRCGILFFEPALNRQHFIWSF